MYFHIIEQLNHYTDFIMGVMASPIIGLAIVYSTVYSGSDQRKHQRSASLAIVLGIHRWPVNSPHKWPVTWKMFLFDDVIMFNIIISIAIFLPLISLLSLNPTFHHVLLLCKFEQTGVVVELITGYWAIPIDNNAVILTIIDDFFLMAERVQLDLVYGWCHATCLSHTF